MLPARSTSRCASARRSWSWRAASVAADVPAVPLAAGATAARSAGAAGVPSVPPPCQRTRSTTIVSTREHRHLRGRPHAATRAAPSQVPRVQCRLPPSHAGAGSRATPRPRRATVPGGRGRPPRGLEPARSSGFDATRGRGRRPQFLVAVARRPRAATVRRRTRKQPAGCRRWRRHSTAAAIRPCAARAQRRARHTPARPPPPAAGPCVPPRGTCGGARRPAPACRRWAPRSSWRSTIHSWLTPRSNCSIRRADSSSSLLSRLHQSPRRSLRPATAEACRRSSVTRPCSTPWHSSVSCLKCRSACSRRPHRRSRCSSVVSSCSRRASPSMVGPFWPQSNAVSGFGAGMQPSRVTAVANPDSSAVSPVW